MYNPLFDVVNDETLLLDNAQGDYAGEMIELIEINLTDIGGGKNITSSITLVTIQFIFSDEVANSLNEPFSILHKTEAKRKSAKIISFVGPVEQKRKLVQKQFKNVHAGLHLWFYKNFPGHFALSKEKLPTISLVTTAEYKQDLTQKNIPKDHYSDMLFDYGTENWTSKNIPELELRVQLNKGSLGILFGNFGDLTQNDLKQYGGTNRESITNKFNLAIGKTMGLWAIHHSLLNYEKQLSAIRDKAVSPIKKTGHAIQNLNFIRSHFLATSTDIQIISHDINNLIKSKSIYSNDCMDFLPPEYYKKGHSNFLEMLRQQDEMRVKTLKIQGERVNESINASGNLTSAIANLRVQRNMFRLTTAIVILTIILTIFSIYKSDPLLNQLHEKLDYLIDTVKKLEIIK